MNNHFEEQGPGADKTRPDRGDGTPLAIILALSLLFLLLTCAAFLSPDLLAKGTVVTAGLLFIIVGIIALASCGLAQFELLLQIIPGLNYSTLTKCWAKAVLVAIVLHYCGIPEEIFLFTAALAWYLVYPSGFIWKVGGTYTPREPKDCWQLSSLLFWLSGVPVSYTMEYWLELPTTTTLIVYMVLWENYLWKKCTGGKSDLPEESQAEDNQ